jgi:hypothetical protein
MWGINLEAIKAKSSIFLMMKQNQRGGVGT